MERSLLQEKLAALAAGVLGRPDLQLHEDTKASDVRGWDSLNHVKLLVAVENAFGIRFGNEDLEDPRNWGEFVDAVAAKIGKRAAAG